MMSLDSLITLKQTILLKKVPRTINKPCQISFNMKLFKSARIINALIEFHKKANSHKLCTPPPPKWDFVIKRIQFNKHVWLVLTVLCFELSYCYSNIDIIIKLALQLIINFSCLQKYVNKLPYLLLKIKHIKFIYFWTEIDMKIDQDEHDEAPGQEN